MSESPPKISVILAVYNGARFIGPAVESILNQTMRDFELIVIDDGSTDETPRVLAEYKDARMRILRNDTNCGLAASLNRGIGEARGEYLARMDGDDLSQPVRFEKQAAFLDAYPKVVLLGTAYEEIDEADHSVRFSQTILDNDSCQTALFSRNRFCHGSVMMRREALAAVGGYREAFQRSQDYDLWLRMAERGRIANLPDYLYRWRRHSGRVSVQQADLQTTQAEAALAEAWRRRARSLRLWKQPTLLAWARAAVQQRRAVAGAMLLLKAFLAQPLSAAPWRLALGRLTWAVSGRLSIGKAAAIRNEKRLQKEIADKETVLRSHPSHLTLLLIDKCNAKCIMCGGGYFAHSSGRRLTVQKCEKLFDHLHPGLLTHVMFGGAGEPLLNPEFIEIAALTRRRCPDAALLLITNGIAMNQQIIAALVRHRIDVLVSINAAIADTYRRIVQVDAFEKVRGKVAALVKASRQAGAGLHVTLSMIGTRRCIGELSQLVRLAAQLGADEVLMNYCRFYPEHRRFKNYDRADCRLQEDESLFYHQRESDAAVAEARRLAAELGVHLEHEPLFRDPDADTGEFGCTYAWRTIFAGFDGELFWCPEGEVLFEDAVGDGHYASGNLAQQDIAKVRNNPFFVRLRESITGRTALLPECAHCGNRIEWMGPAHEGCHILDWQAAYRRASGEITGEAQ